MEFLFLICARDTSKILPVIPPQREIKMLIMITMDKIFRDINYNIIISQCNCTVTVHVISQLSLKNLRDYFSDMIRTICHH